MGKDPEGEEGAEGEAAEGVGASWLSLWLCLVVKRRLLFLGCLRWRGYPRAMSFLLVLRGREGERQRERRLVCISRQDRLYTHSRLCLRRVTVFILSLSPALA